MDVPDSSTSPERDGAEADDSFAGFRMPLSGLADDPQLRFAASVPALASTEGGCGEATLSQLNSVSAGRAGSDTLTEAESRLRISGRLAATVRMLGSDEFGGGHLHSIEVKEWNVSPAMGAQNSPYLQSAVPWGPY